MDKQVFKILLFLGLWVLNSLGCGAFASTPEVVQGEEGSGYEIRQIPGPGAAYLDQINIFEVEPAPQKEFPLLLFPFPADTFVLPEKKNPDSRLYDFFLRDQKHDLKQQIFPFHFFW